MILRRISSFGLLALASLVLSACSTVQLRFGAKLQSTDTVVSYQPDVATRLFTESGAWMGDLVFQETEESEPEARIFIDIADVPDHVRAAFISAEDKNFYDHYGVDWVQFGKALVQNAQAVASGNRVRGGSTLTMQTVKNFVTGSDRTVERKIYEILIAFQLERELSKDDILERYLNEIYFGNRSYGLVAAAQTYFDKPVAELTVPEAAVLASLPKAPSVLNPFANPDRARERRDWVIGEMAENGYITAEEAVAYQASELSAPGSTLEPDAPAPYFGAEVSRVMGQAFGDEFSRNGYMIDTTLDPEMQAWGEAALRAGMVRYDRTQGYRGRLEEIDLGTDWRGDFATRYFAGALDWEVAVVTEITNPCRDAVRPNADGEDVALSDIEWFNEAGFRTDWSCALVEFQDGSWGVVPYQEVQWARAWRGQGRLGPGIRTTADVLSPGHVVTLERLESGIHSLVQIPEVAGAFVALDPHTGRVLSLVGGWDHTLREFNSATQGNRQPGSTFKPFVYLTALEAGYAPNDTINDLPIEIEQASGENWRPGNSDSRFLGPVTLRRGLEGSRNLPTVRVAGSVGMEQVVETAATFGADPEMEPVLSNALGSSETQLLTLTAAYGRLANGGRNIPASLIDQVRDRDGDLVYDHSAFRAGEGPCLGCDQRASVGSLYQAEHAVADQLADPSSVFNIVAMMRGVMQRGTGTRLNRQLTCDYVAGKTGTTNDFRDAWFIGFTPDLVAGVWIGHYDFSSLGNRQYGGVVAGPVFVDFMNQALEARPELCRNFTPPEGRSFARLNLETGLPWNYRTGRALPEAFATAEEDTCPFRNSEGYCTQTRPAQTTITVTDSRGNTTRAVIEVSDESVF